MNITESLRNRLRDQWHESEAREAAVKQAAIDILRDDKELFIEILVNNFTDAGLDRFLDDPKEEGRMMLLMAIDQVEDKAEAKADADFERGLYDD